MITVTLAPDGGFGGIADFIHSKDGAEPIAIDWCHRCIGLLIRWKRRDDCDPRWFAPAYAVCALHIPPYAGKAKGTRSQFFQIIRHIARAYTPTSILYCGGKIDTPANKVHYERSKNFFLLPLQKHFPSAKVCGLDPTPEQNCSAMFMNEFGEVTFERKLYR